MGTEEEDVKLMLRITMKGELVHMLHIKLTFV